MRKPEYLSYSSMTLFYQDPSTFYQRYLMEKRGSREPQTLPMSVGSAFDAYVKSYLFEKIVGRKDPNHEFTTLFERQVEPQNRVQALKDGKSVFDFYKQSGALADLMLDMEGCVGEPRFETEITGLISRSNKIGKVPLLGKPDIYFVTKSGARIIFDWKVNGFYSENPPSPKGGYIKLFPGLSRHKDCTPYNHREFLVNSHKSMDQVAEDWASQTSTYAWVLGEPVGGDFIVVIDQLACNKHTLQHRVARHAGLVQPKFQEKVYDKYLNCWEAIQSGHIFQNLNYEDNVARCKTIEKLATTDVPYDPVFNMLTDIPKKRWR